MGASLGVVHLGGCPWCQLRKSSNSTASVSSRVSRGMELWSVQSRLTPANPSYVCVGGLDRALSTEKEANNFCDNPVFVLS